MSIPSGERLARVALGSLGEPGDPRLARLVAEAGAERVHALLTADRGGEGLATDVAARLAGLDPARILRDADAAGARYVCPGDPEWPDRLDDLDRCETLNGRGGTPLGLWIRGPQRLDAVCARAVSVVGSRSATTYGTGVAGEIAAHLAEAGSGVVSGAAFGIDQAAHRGALAVRGATVAVLACGVDRAYPSAHRELVRHIAETGLVVSELPPGAAPTRLRFLARNRLIAALTLGTVVVEAAVRSGALNSANWAGLLNRTVMGVPGPVTSAPSQGVHELIRTGGAALVTCGSDVRDLVSPAGSDTRPRRRAPEGPLDRLREADKQVLDAVPVLDPAPLAALARTAGLATDRVAAGLTRLGAAGLVEQCGTGWRRRDTRRAV